MNLDAIKDAHMKRSIEDQIINFGQTPSQLLSTPHPRRAPFLHTDTTMFFSREVSTSYKLIQPIDSAKFISQIMEVDSGNETFLLTSGNLSSIYRCQVNTLLLSCQLTKMYSLSMLIFRPIDLSWILPNSGYPFSNSQIHLAIGGYWDYSVKVFSLTGKGHVQTLYGHTDIVTCVAYCRNGGKIFATGSRDTCIRIYNLVDGKYVLKRTLHSHSNSISRMDINTGVGIIASCSVSIVYIN